ncbi:putative transcription factor interactor and regulator AUX-IAA family [Helianthus annuus]|nr:putative transcription factor interactor and regulator AUX-IAA family [Helianthus annuus]
MLQSTGASLISPSVEQESTSPSAEQESTLDAQNHGLFSNINIDSSGLLLPTIDPDLSTIPSSPASMFQNFGYIQDSSELMQSNANPNRTFVKVYKSGCVGRSLDMSRFNSYHELREELGQMFGIEGLLEDPQRSGWLLLFIDRENDVLLLGDDPWE